jgi:HK97 family phage prohead protease
MEIRDFGLKIKSLNDQGTFEGLASPYGDPPDLGGDVIQKGAFTQAIRQQPAAGYPLLWVHQHDQPLGVARIEDSPSGLAVNGKLFLEDPNAQKAYIHAKGGSVRGISISFLPPRADAVAYRDDGARVLKQIHLIELSLCPVPMAPRAQITSVKSLGDVRHVLKSLRDGDVDDDSLSDLLAIDLELKRLLVGRDPAEVKAQTMRELQAFADSLKRMAA